ncbi:MAG TPA: amylo-alpha-1,6-glucosidase [Ktedonobacterales bacterium]|jgi:glycogen debranching enzyme
MDTTLTPPFAYDISPAQPFHASQVRQARGLPTYILADTALEMGASLGNSRCWLTTKGTGDIETLFSTFLGTQVTGAICVRYSGVGQRLVRVGQAGAAADGAAEAFIQLRPQEAGEFELHPAYQRHRFALPGWLSIEETVFVPAVTSPAEAPHLSDLDRPIVYTLIKIQNRDTQPRTLRVYGYAHFHGKTPLDLQATYAPDLGRGALIARNQSRPDWVRIFGVVGSQVQVKGWQTSFDSTQMYETTHVLPLKNDTSATGRILGALQVDVELQPQQTVEFGFVTVFSHEGEADARHIFQAATDYGAAFNQTVAWYTRALEPSQVITPDPLINQGITWAKVNMLRVMADFPTGPAFTNDPSLSSAVVARDAAWFAWGCDYLMPEFSRRLLDAFAKRQRPSGLILEYYNAVTDHQEDDGLNINDDTPLFIMAARHHCLITGDMDYTRHIYPAVRRAAYYIMSQRDTFLDEIPPERKYGLVTCTARGVEDHGIASWRNIIPNYTLNGAVAEINAECVAALRWAAELAEMLGEPEQQEDARKFHEAAEALAQAMNTHLLNPESHLYYLTIDLDGNIVTDVTADELFPVMFGVADAQVAFRIISRLNSPDFWTPAGIRTVSRISPDYDPYRQWGLMGGVWPGVTWWYAFAAAKYHPEFMVRALRASFEYYARDPKKNLTVPGQFSEWIDGESLVNRGMRLSPWEPPRFLLAAVSGVCGLSLRKNTLHSHPLLPADWKWVGLRRFPYHGQEIAFFATRQRDGAHLYGTTALETERELEQHRYAEDITPEIFLLNPLAQHIAFKNPGEILVCVGSAGQQTALVPLRLGNTLEPQKRYQIDIYNSEWHAWVPGEVSQGKDLAELAVSMEEGGYRLIRFREQA